ncbi:unnamed protein product, partial [Symbiodinium sp. KB8]
MDVLDGGTQGRGLERDIPLLYFQSRPDGTFILPPSKFPHVFVNEARDIAAGDWDGDGDVDLVVCDVAGLRYYERVHDEIVTERTGWENPFQNVSGERVEQCFVVDWNSDGRADLLLHAGLALLRWEQQSNGSLAEQGLIAGQFNGVSCFWGGNYQDQALDIGDFNEDGLLDVVFKERNPYYGDGHVGVCEREATGGLKRPVWLFSFKPSRYMNGLKMIPCQPMKGPCFILDQDMWSSGFCVKEGACAGRGACTSRGCTCAEEYKGATDCSQCARNYHSLGRRFGAQFDCSRCAGDGLVCAARGLCDDDSIQAWKAQRSGSNLTVRLVQGNGSCTCSEHFGACHSSNPSSMVTKCIKSMSARSATLAPPLPVQPVSHAARVVPPSVEAVNVLPAPRATSQPQRLLQRVRNAELERGPRKGKVNAQTVLLAEPPAVEAASALHVLLVDLWLQREPLSAPIVHQGGLLQVSLAVFTLCVLASSYLLLTSFTFSLDITDVSLNNGTVVLTTHQPHHILRWAHPLVTLRDTGVPELDHSPNFGVKATGGKHLELTSSDEEKSWGPFTSTSQGQLGIGFCSFFKAVGLLGLPSLLWLLALLCLAILSSLQAQALMQGLVSLVALLLVLALRVWSPFSGTPLALARQRFAKQLLQKNPKPMACERGAARALHLQKLKDFYDFFNAFIQDRSMYYVCSNLVVPLTKPFKLSYAELAGPSEVVWFVSHYWGMPLRHFIEAIQSHSQSRAAARAALPSYWVCTFSNNQWKVAEELGQGDWQDSSFFKALRSQTCKGTLMIIDEQALPLHRAWCLFEVLQTVLRSQGDQDFTGFSLGTSSGVLNEGGVGSDLCLVIANKLATLDLRDAEASNRDDEIMIRRLVEAMPGGFDAMNDFIRASIHSALLSMRSRFEENFEQ